jgi:uncharacterized protein with HEPN domain
VSRDPLLYLEDLHLACKKILAYTDGMDFDSFITSSLTYDAVMRNLEIIGEAAKNVPEELKAEYEYVEWRAAAALRNILAHAYFSIKDEIIWDVVTNKVPTLLNQVTEIINKKR